MERGEREPTQDSMFRAGHEPTQDSAFGEGHEFTQGSAFGEGHESTQSGAFGAGHGFTQTDPWDRREASAQPDDPSEVDIAISNGLGAVNPTGLKAVKPLSSYSVAVSGKRAGKIGDDAGAAFVVLECAIERGDKVQLPLDSCIEGPHCANGLLCLVAGGYAELCSPLYARKRLIAQTMLPVPKSMGVQCLSESSVARLMYAIFIVTEMSSRATIPPTKQGPCSDSSRSGPTPEAISKTSRLLVGRAAEK